MKLSLKGFSLNVYERFCIFKLKAQGEEGSLALNVSETSTFKQTSACRDASAFYFHFISAETEGKDETTKSLKV